MKISRKDKPCTNETTRWQGFSTNRAMYVHPIFENWNHRYFVVAYAKPSCVPSYPAGESHPLSLSRPTNLKSLLIPLVCEAYTQPSIPHHFLPYQSFAVTSLNIHPYPAPLGFRETRNRFPSPSHFPSCTTPTLRCSISQQTCFLSDRVQRVMDR